MRIKNLRLIIVLSLLPCMAFALPPVPDDFETEIDAAVAWLKDHQNLDGSWSYGSFGEVVSQTGFVLTKLSDYARENGDDPMTDPNVLSGLDYILSKARTYSTGITITNTAVCDHHANYNSAVALMALANLGDLDHEIDHPNPVVDEKTIGEVMAEMVDYFAAVQRTDGGWTYEPCSGGLISDNSHTGYVVLALRYAEAAGITIPAGVKTKLDSFIDLIQDDVDGSSWYRPPGLPGAWHWPNALKQGNLLFEMAFVGDDLSTPRVQAALAYLASIWDAPTTDIYSLGWKDPQAMFCLMKGFTSLGIETIEVSATDRDWYAEFTAQLLLTKIGDIWPNSVWTSGSAPVVSTSWSLFVLEKVAPPLLVHLDIHPMSWPNPINIKSKGLTPVAIIGTESFDVTNVDVSTVLLEGVAPVKWALFDSTQVAEDAGGCNATTLGDDGYMDLFFYFDTQELAAALGDVNDGDELILELTGQTLSGTDFVGDDCIIIKKKGKSAIIDSEEFMLMQNYPNPFSTRTRIEYQVPVETHVLLKVFNIMGQEVETLVNYNQQPGYYSVDFDSRNLPNGQYIYRISASDFTDTRIMNIFR